MTRKKGPRVPKAPPPALPPPGPWTRIAAALVLLLIVGVLFSLRMKPDARHDVELQLDAAFNYRMTYELVNHGAVPALDTLSTYPEGKPVTALLPTGLYSACAAFSKVLNLFTSVPLNVTGGVGSPANAVAVR